MNQIMRSVPRARKVPKLILGLMLGVLIIVSLPIVASVGAYGYLEAFGIILPGVEIGDVSLEGLAIHEAAEKLDTRYNLEYVIELVDTLEPGRSWAVAPSELGLFVDSHSSATFAHGVGREEGLAAGVEQMLADEWQAEPQVVFNPLIARSALEEWAVRVDVSPVEALLRLEDGEVVYAPGQTGKALDIEASLALLAADPAAVYLGYQFVPLVMVPIEPAIKDVSAAVAKAEAFLNSELTFQIYDPVNDEMITHSPDRSVIAKWLDIEHLAAAFTVDINRDLLAAYISKIDGELGEERSLNLDEATAMAWDGLNGLATEPMVLHYLPTTYVVPQSQSLVYFSFHRGIPYWKLQELNPQLYGRDLLAGEAITLPPKDAMLVQPVVLNKRIVISIAEQIMSVYQDGELIGESIVSTGIAGSPTMAGIFQVQSHFENAYASRWDLWMPNFLGIYEAAPGFLNGIHGLPLLSNGVRLWESVLGSPASFGCVVLDLETAEHLFEWAENGVVVEIRS